MKFSIGFSPCPNDTFIFDALINRQIDTEDISFEPVLEDVEWLNRAAGEGQLDICKVSYAMVPLLAGKYRLLDSGGALGKAVGPLLIHNDRLLSHLPDDLPVALPGRHTTAHLLFSYAFPGHTAKKFMRYDQIESYVQEGRGAGVIIHENRFTYQDKGLFLLKDLGAFWEKQTGQPIPLGGIMVRQDIPEWMQLRLSQLISDSIQFSRNRYPQLSDFIRKHAQEMSEEVMRKHIELYVNDFSSALGREGVEAIRTLTAEFNRMFDQEVDPSSFLPVGT
jgi:1,4-dihydroxy-6-naphthoate synthase